MEPIIAHFQANQSTYIILGVCSLPLIFFTRKYSVPVILYLVEYAIYLFCAHSIFYAVLNLAKWFKTNSSMKALRKDGTPIDAPEWTMPYFEFWKRELYNPNWIWMTEAVLAVLILGAMWRYRPMKVQAKRIRRFSDSGKKRTDFSKYNPRNKKSTS